MNLGELNINIILKGKHLKIFQNIKEEFGHESNAETLRYILMEFNKCTNEKYLKEFTNAD